MQKDQKQEILINKLSELECFGEVLLLSSEAPWHFRCDTIGTLKRELVRIYPSLEMTIGSIRAINDNEKSGQGDSTLPRNTLD